MLLSSHGVRCPEGRTTVNASAQDVLCVPHDPGVACPRLFSTNSKQSAQQYLSTGVVRAALRALHLTCSVRIIFFSVVVCEGAYAPFEYYASANCYAPLEMSQALHLHRGGSERISLIEGVIRVCILQVRDYCNPSKIVNL